MWAGYILWSITTPLTDNILDEDGIVTEEGQKTLARRALLGIGRQYGNPNEKTHLVPSNDKQKYIIDIQTPSEPTPAQFYTKLADFLPYTAQQIANNSNFTVSPGENWEERRQATKTYMRNHTSDWVPE